ncbi:hypothetical protein [Neobacillus niacini]|uniref:hypothetical protein n=1 Tax=Neobacillus niacini TaxID=86668 RepID=UPI000A82D694|nr:hypothetical protein [Neobacillus niacini]
MGNNLDLMLFFEGYVRNYRRLNLNELHNRSMFTRREIEHFSNLGEMLGFSVFVEDAKYDKRLKRNRPMDLSWWKWDERIDKDNFVSLALHLERENQWDKDVVTIEKLFSMTTEGYIPQNVIGIQNIESSSRIDYLNKLVFKKNTKQQSNVLMIYRFYDRDNDLDRVWAYQFTPSGIIEERRAICKRDELGYWVSVFEEEYPLLKE